MHFNPAFLFIIPDEVFERSQIELGAQFAIDAPQDVPIESRGDAGRIVVRPEQHLLRLDQIDAEQEAVAISQLPTQGLHEAQAFPVPEIPDAAPEKQQQQRNTVGPAIP